MLWASQTQTYSYTVCERVENNWGTSSPVCSHKMFLFVWLLLVIQVLGTNWPLHGREKKKKRKKLFKRGSTALLVMHP